MILRYYIQKKILNSVVKIASKKKKNSSIFDILHNIRINKEIKTNRANTRRRIQKYIISRSRIFSIYINRRRLFNVSFDRTRKPETPPHGFSFYTHTPWLYHCIVFAKNFLHTLTHVVTSGETDIIIIMFETTPQRSYDETQSPTTIL